MDNIKPHSTRGVILFIAENKKKYKKKYMIFNTKI